MVYLLGFLLLVGATLLVIGLEGRLIDDAPFCTHCRYNLTGLTANRCPECGTEVSPDTVVFGRRARNRPALAAGGMLIALVLVAAGSYVVGEFRGVNWYQYYSVGRLLDMAARGVEPASGELNRRIRLNLASEDERRKMIETALVRQTASPQARPLPVWADLLALFENAAQLTAAQREAFLASVISVKVRVRERVRLGDPIVVAIRVLDRGAPSWTYAAGVQLVELKPSSHAATATFPLFPTFSLNSQSSPLPETLLFPTAAPGRFTASGGIRVTLHDPNVDPDVAAPAWERTTPFALEYEVLSEDSPDPVQWVDSPELAHTIRQAMYPNQVHVECSGVLWRRCQYWQYLFLEQSLNVDLAFEVTFEAGDRTMGGARVTWSKGETGWRLAASDGFKPVDADRVHLVLRSNRDAAIRSVDCYHIWRGEVRIPSVVVSGR